MGTSQLCNLLASLLTVSISSLFISLSLLIYYKNQSNEKHLKIKEKNPPFFFFFDPLIIFFFFYHGFVAFKIGWRRRFKKVDRNRAITISSDFSIESWFSIQTQVSFYILQRRLLLFLFAFWICDHFIGIESHILGLNSSWLHLFKLASFWNRFILV